MKPSTPNAIFAGLLQRDFILLPSGKTLLDTPGGNVLFSAIGYRVWNSEPFPGLVAKVGEDYPESWLAAFQERGIDTRGVSRLPRALDVRAFYSLVSPEEYTTENPVAQYARAGTPFPKALLGYQSRQLAMDSRTQTQPISIRPSDIPADFLEASAIHLCPLDYLSHTLLPAHLRQAAFTTITLAPSSGYMNPTYWGNIPGLVSGISAFLPAERDLRCLFKGRSEDLWEMAETVGSYGCEVVVIRCGERGQMVYDAGNRKRWFIPAYPARVMDTSRAGDVFCGGFLEGYRQTYDPIQAALQGNISASLAIEGSGAFYALDALPSLVKARLESIQQAVKNV